jgi:ribokinase
MLKAITIGRATFEINLVVDKLPDEGTVNEYFDKGGNIGGGTGIVGTALSKWGVAVAMATVLGNDNNGTRVRKILESLRIDTRYIEPSYDNDTPLSLIVSNNNSGRHTVYNLSDKFVSLKKLDFDFQPDFIYSDGYDATQTKNLFERYPHSIRILDGTMISAAVIEDIKKANYVVCSIPFAEYVSKVKIDVQDPSSLVRCYQSLKKKYLYTEFVVTLGERGALYCINNQIKVTPSLKVKTVDTYGCKDIFRAAFSYVIGSGGDVEKATKMGCIAAGLAATKVGGYDAIPTLEEMKNLYEQNYQ